MGAKKVHKLLFILFTYVGSHIYNRNIYIYICASLQSESVAYAATKVN